MLTNREITEKKARREAILQEKEEILQKTKIHRENPTKDGNEELKQLIVRSKELADELQKIDAELQADEVERQTQNIFIKKEKTGGNKNMNIENMTREQILGSTLYRDAFYKRLFKDKLKKDLNEDEKTILRLVDEMDAGSINDGSEYILPTTTINKIQSIISEEGKIWNLVSKTNFKGNVEFPVGTRVSADVEVDDEDKPITGVAQLVYKFTQVAIKQTAIVAEIKVPNLLLANAIEDLENYLAAESAKYLAEQLDYKVLAGDGGSGDYFMSILEEAGGGEYDNLDYNLLMTIQASMKSAYAKDAIWVMNRKTYFTQIRGMTDAEGRLIAGQVPLANGNARAVQYLVDGIPCELNDNLPDGAILFANFNYYKANVSKNITINVNSSIYENIDMTAWYAKIYAGGQILFPTETMLYYTKAASQG